MPEEINIISDKDLEAPLALAGRYSKLADTFDDVVIATTKLNKSLEEGTTSTKEQREASNGLIKAQKDLDKANDKAAKSQKNFAVATNAADEATGGMITKVKTLGKQFLALLTNPIGAFFLLIAGALASISVYFKSTNDGADKFEKIMNALGGVVDFFTVKIGELGEQIVKLFEDGNALGTVFTFIFDQVINRIAGAIDFFTNLLKVINTLSKYNLKDIFTGNLSPADLKELKTAATDMGKGFVSALTGIGTAADEVHAKLEALNSLTESADKLGDEIRDRILSKAQALLEIEKQMFIFKDKGNHTDAQRVEALQKVISLSEQQLKIDIDLATRKERQYTAELLQAKGIITTNEEANRVLAKGTTLLQDQLLEHKAIDSELEERRKLQADIINLETSFFAEQKKNAAQLGNLTMEISEDARKGRIEAFDAQIKKAKEASTEEILGLRSTLQVKDDLNKSFSQRLVDETKERLKQQEDAEKEHQKRITEELQRQEEERRAITQASIQALAMIGNEIFARRKEKLDVEAQEIEARRAKELAGAEGDERKKLAINRKFDREQAKIKTKQAQADKQAALFNVLINTAVGITRVAPNPVLIAIVAAIGAIQAALIASKPLPKFWMGTKNSPNSFIAGDRGRELVEHGNRRIVAEKPTVFTNMPGSTVYTKAQTDEILGNTADVGHALRFGAKPKHRLASSSIVADRLYESNKLLKKIANKPEAGLIIDEEGFRKYSDKMERKSRRINKRFYGK